MSLKRELSLSDAILLVVGNVVGAGIFTTSGFLAGELPQPTLFIAIWVLGGLLTLCGACAYAELAALYPLAGGDYQYLKAAYGGGAGFLLGWTNFWIIGPGSSAALSLALVSYLNAWLPLGGGTTGSLAAAAVIVVFSLINLRGIRPGGTTQDLITTGTILLLIIMIMGGFLFGQGSWGNFSSSAPANSSWRKLVSSPMIAVIFTYSGWFASAQIGGEIRDPERNLPRSLIMGTLAVMALYTAINLLYLYGLPLTAMKGAENVAQLAVARLFSPGVAALVSIPIVLAIAASINANIMTGARVCYAMASDGRFWSPFGKLHRRYNTPHLAILAQSVIAVLLVFFGSFSQLLGYVVFPMILSSMATGVALFVLRFRIPHLPRPYRTLGYPIVPLIFVVSYGLIALEIGRTSPGTSLLGIGIALSGIPFYLWWLSKGGRHDKPFAPGAGQICSPDATGREPAGDCTQTDQ